MSKPIQSVDVSSMVPKASHTAANAVSSEDDAASFSKVLSENEAGAAQKGGPQTSPEGGKKLPHESESDGGQQPVKGESNSQTLTEAQNKTEAGTGTGIDEPLPVESSDEAMLLQAQAQFAGASKELPVQEIVPVEQPATQAAEVPATDLTAVAVKQGTSVPAPVADTSVPIQALDALQALQPANAGAVPGTEQSLQANGLQVPVLADAKAATERLVPVEIPVKAPVAESTASAVREAVQLAVANQGANDGLKQSLSDGRNFQPEIKFVAQNPVDTGSAVFSQALTDTSQTLPSSKVQIPVGQSGWGRAVGQQVVWFVSQNISAANLRLNPQQLGPMEMQVSMDGDKATVAFVSQHAAVREALESAIPRLREMLAENGLDLANVNVSQQGNHGQRDQASTGSEQSGEAVNSGASGDEMEMVQGMSLEINTVVGLVDYYV